MRGLQRLTHCESPSPRVAPLTRKRVFDSVHRERSDPRPTTNTGTLHRSLRTGSRMMPILTVTDLFEGLATNHAVLQRLQYFMDNETIIHEIGLKMLAHSMIGTARTVRTN